MYLLDYILCDLYSKNGYFHQMGIKTSATFVSNGAGCGCSPEFVAEFISGCIRCSFLIKVFEMFGALTSVGIQRRFIRMLNSRENFTFIEEYFLLDTSDKKMFRKVFLINLHLKRFR